MCHSVSMPGPLSSRTKKQMVRLLVGMWKLSKPFQFWPEPLYKAIFHLECSEINHRSSALLPLVS